MKTEPPSPKNTLAGYQFKIKKPKIDPAKTKANKEVVEPVISQDKETKKIIRLLLQHYLV